MLSIGFGPRIFGWKRGYTEYWVSWIPLGGYVKMAGEQQSEKAGNPWEYLAKPIRVRAGIVFAGPFVNYLVGFLCLWTVYMIGFPELTSKIGEVADEMPGRLTRVAT